MNTRSVLEYVPYFRDRLFIVHIAPALQDAPELVDALLDLDALHEIGVRLVVIAGAWDSRDLFDQAVACELRAALTNLPVARDSLSQTTARIGEILSRGQVALASGPEHFAAPELVELATRISASKYIALVDQAVPQINNAPIPAILQSEVESVLPEVQHADLLVSAATMCRSGIPRVHILDGRARGALLDELFSEEGVGTMVHTDSYREIRPLRIEDIPELLSLIGRSVKDSKLVERTYEDVCLHLSNYFVITLDESIVGSVALYPFVRERVGEIACLYIKNQHANRGYGRLLVEHALQHASMLGLREVFAVSQSARDFFQARMKFEERPRTSLPASRYEKLERSGRASSVFWTPVP